MRRSPVEAWWALGFDAWRLSLEASTVIGLRTARLAQGGALAQAEAQRMVAEKMAAGAALAGIAMTGGLGADPARASARVLAHYRRPVRANRRRLSRPG